METQSTKKDFFKEIWTHPAQLLSLVLIAIGIHSIMVGIGLIIQPEPVMIFAGFNHCSERFFPTQGGIFHILMAAAYLMAAKNPLKNECLIPFTILVKGSAAVFLGIYFLMVNQIWVVLLSGILDGLMCIVVIWVYARFKKWQRRNDGVASDHL